MNHSSLLAGLLLLLVAAPAAHADEPVLHAKLRPVKSIAKLAEEQNGLVIDTSGVCKGHVRQLVVKDGTVTAFLSDSMCTSPRRWFEGPRASMNCPGPAVGDTSYFEITVTHVSAQTMVGSLRIHGGFCSVDLNGIFYASDSKTWSAPREGLVVQVLQGAEDQTLFRAVKTQLSRKDALGTGSLPPPALFEGAKAKNPRTVSEIFWGKTTDDKKEENEAQVVAWALKPVLGPIKPKPWPSECDYAVVIVVGDQVAPAPVRQP